MAIILSRRMLHGRGCLGMPRMGLVMDGRFCILIPR
jgi:hypothetical protein